jgi:hypothetical protein
MNVKPALKSRTLVAARADAVHSPPRRMHVTKWRLLVWLSTRKVIPPSEPSSLSSFQGARHGFDGDGSWVDLAGFDSCFASLVAIALWDKRAVSHFWQMLLGTPFRNSLTSPGC